MNEWRTGGPPTEVALGGGQVGVCGLRGQEAEVGWVLAETPWL